MIEVLAGAGRRCKVVADRESIRQVLVDALYLSFGQEEVDAAMSTQPDDYMLELDSKAAEFLLVAAEVFVGRDLPCPADLGRSQYASLGLLIDVVLKGS
jgi:hypothetical protein